MISFHLELRLNLTYLSLRRPAVNVLRGMLNTFTLRENAKEKLLWRTANARAARENDSGLETHQLRRELRAITSLDAPPILVKPDQ